MAPYVVVPKTTNDTLPFVGLDGLPQSEVHITVNIRCSLDSAVEILNWLLC